MLFNPHVSSLSFIKRGVTIELSIFLITKALYEGLIFLSIFEKIFSFDFMNFIDFGRDIFFLYTGLMSLAIPIIDKQSALLGVISISIIVSFLVLTIEATSNPNDVMSPYYVDGRLELQEGDKAALKSMYTNISGQALAPIDSPVLGEQIL